jgi:hypothetical protein
MALALFMHEDNFEVKLSPLLLFIDEIVLALLRECDRRSCYFLFSN